MATNNLGDIDADYYARVLTTFKTGVEMWHSELAEYSTLANDAIGLALGACRRGASMANALNTPSGKLREATEKLAIDAIVLLGGSTAGKATLHARIDKLAQAVTSYRDRLDISSEVYRGRKRGDALVHTLRQIDDLIGGAPHFTHPHVSGSPPPIKPASFSDFITAFEHFQRALEDLYASPQTVSEARLKDSAGHPQYSIYAQDAARTLRTQGAESLKKMLAADHADVLGTAHMLEQHGHLSVPSESHDSFATRLFDPMAEIAIRGLELKDALTSDAPAILIHGDGGCGKTVALWRFGLKTNTDGEREDIALYTKLDPGFPSSTLQKQIAAAARYASDSRRVYVLLDGLDEVRSRRSKVVSAITDLISTYPKLFWRISTRELGEEVPEETRVWHLFKMEPFGTESIVSGIQRLNQIAPAMRDHAVALIKSEKPLASLLGTAFYYTLFCWRLLEFSRLGVSTLSSQPRQLFRSSLLKFALEKYIERESERNSLTATPQAIAGWIIAWKKAVFDEQVAVPNASRVNDQIMNPAIKHELFCDWLLASYLAEESPQVVQAALSKMPGPRRRSVMSLMLEVLLLADRTTALTETMFRIVNLPRKSRHLDLTREEVSDAESGAEEN